MRGSREARAMSKSTRYGRKKQETALEERRGRRALPRSPARECASPNHLDSSTAF